MSFKLKCDSIPFSPAFFEYIENYAKRYNTETIDIGNVVDFIKDNESDAINDVLLDLYSEGRLMESISYNAARAAFISETEEKIRFNSAKYDIVITEINESEGCEKSVTISGANILLDVLEEKSNDGEFDAYISRYVERCLEAFVENSEWHYGYIEQNGAFIELSNSTEYKGSQMRGTPILWFGPDGMQPNDKWSIKYDEELSYSWFESEPWILVEYFLEDCAEGFLIWYTAECGCEAPDMEEIMKKCPIQFEKDDSIERVDKKIDAFFGRL